MQFKLLFKYHNNIKQVAFFLNYNIPLPLTHDKMHFESNRNSFPNGIFWIRVRDVTTMKKKGKFRDKTKQPDTRHAYATLQSH